MRRLFDSAATQSGVRSRSVALPVAARLIPMPVSAPFRSARGLPRLVNRIAHYAFTGGAVKGARSVTAEHLDHAIEELQL